MKVRQKLGVLHRAIEFPSALRILSRLKESGFEAVLAGGAVRDALLGRPAKDLDIATSALPADIEKLFQRTVAVGKAFGTIVVVEDGLNFEVTTFRREGPYRDGRHPEYVEPTHMAEDALRRDFTVNALFYDPVDECVHDLVGGVADLRARRLATVGTARARFDEDHLRRLRAVRFVAQLGFTLDPEVESALLEDVESLRRVSGERILAEMSRLAMGPDVARAFEMFTATGMAAVIWPEVISVRGADLKPFAPFVNVATAFAALSLLAGLPPASRLRAWKAPTNLIRQANDIWRAVEVWGKARPAERLTWLHPPVMGPGIKQLLLGRGLDLAADLAALNAIIDPSGELPAPFLNGNDLLRLGVAKGQRLGVLLRQIYEAQLERRTATRAEAEQFLAKLLAE